MRSELDYIIINDEQICRPPAFAPEKEDIYKGDYTTCTGKIIADRVGAQTGYKKVKGRQTSMQEIVNLMKETIIDPENQTIYLLHGDCLDEALELEKMVKESIPCKDVYISYIGPIIGASLGPDALVLYAWGQEVTFEG